MNILNLTITNPFMLVAISFALGLFISYICTKTLNCTKNMSLSLVILPAVVCGALLAVNGSLGTSIAVLGIFSLVRFRSLPGSSKDIISIFLAMTAGLLVSTTYIVTAIGLVAFMGIMLAAISKLLLTSKAKEHPLKILIAENVEFDNVFNEVFEKYFTNCKLEKVKTSNMGTMFELNYKVMPKANISIKSLLDDIKCLNGNLNVSFLTSQEMEEL